MGSNFFKKRHESVAIKPLLPNVFANKLIERNIMPIPVNLNATVQLQ
jgi:hypothetical protein